MLMCELSLHTLIWSKQSRNGNRRQRRNQWQWRMHCRRRKRRRRLTVFEDIDATDGAAVPFAQTSGVPAETKAN
jgi:hypothetical protein